MLFLFAVLAVTQLAASPTQVGGVRVYGRTNEVRTADIHDAIKESKRAAHLDGAGQLVALEVINRNEMRSFFRRHILWWELVRHMQVTDAHGQLLRSWDCSYFDITMLPHAFEQMRSASSIYIFPVRYKTLEPVRTGSTEVEPYWDQNRFRSLGADARRELVGIIGHEKDWFHGMNDVVTTEPEPENIGLSFRNGSKEVILYFTQCGIGGRVNGQRTSGTLQFKTAERLESWRRKYAQPEVHR